MKNHKLNTSSGLPYRQQTTVTVSLADHATYAAAEAITYLTDSTWNTSDDTKYSNEYQMSVGYMVRFICSSFIHINWQGGSYMYR